MSDPIIASVLAKAGLDTNGKIDGGAVGGGTDGVRQPTEPASRGAAEADHSADAHDNAEAEPDYGADANDAPNANDDDDDGESDSDGSVEADDDGGGASADAPEEEDDDAPNANDDDGESDGDDDDPAKAIVAAFPDDDDDDAQDVEVVAVAAAASCLALPSKATAAKEDRRLVELRGKGFTDEQLRAVGAVLSTASRRQRKLPVHAAVCSAVMQAYWAGRDRERREADCMKAIRNDGGQLGPVRYYESIIRKHDPLAAAKLLAEHHGERITAIRYIVTATFNEGRREDAVAKGVDPTTVKYLQVRAK